MPRDPRKSPVVGDVISVGGSQREVFWVGCSFGTGDVIVEWVRSCGDSGHMSLNSWKAWARKGTVVRCGQSAEKREQLRRDLGKILADALKGAEE